MASPNHNPGVCNWNEVFRRNDPFAGGQAELRHEFGIHSLREDKRPEGASASNAIVRMVFPIFLRSLFGRFDGGEFLST